jgi:pimeloyl-ACP methyl ester carboxylesterase
MAILAVVLVLALLVWAACGLAGMARHVGAGPAPSGNREAGLVIFVESVRWLGVAWGRQTTALGLQQAGFRGEFLYWRWHATWRGWLVLPALLDSRLLEHEAARLAEFISNERRTHPARPIYLIGYSAGGFVSLRALELLPANVRIDALAMLAPAVSPWRKLDRALRRVKGRCVVASSIGDWCIAGLGTLLFGTADRRFVPSMGMLGVRRRARARIVELRWRPGMLAAGHWGGHFHASATKFIADHVAPAMGLVPDRVTAWPAPAKVKSVAPAGWVAPAEAL